MISEIEHSEQMENLKEKIDELERALKDAEGEIDQLREQIKLLEAMTKEELP